MALYNRPGIVYDDTNEAQILVLIAEGVCNVFGEFPGFCDLSRLQIKRTVDGLRKKGLVVYLPDARAWKATRAGMSAYGMLAFDEVE